MEPERGTMKAVVFDRYGPPEVLQIVDVPKPVPADDEILVRIHATTVNSGDARVRALRVPRGLSVPVRFTLGFRGPKQPILGFDLAGEVETTGRAVTRFKPGDRVIGSAGFKLGCHAEYRCLPEDGAIAPIPVGLSYGEAVSVLFGGATALYFLKSGDLKPGERILINGASGAVGTMAVQLAKQLGAEVTGVCSTRNVELVESLGADHVIDYTGEDFSQGGEAYDVVMDTVGNAPYSRSKKSLRPGGRFLMVIGDLPQMMQGRFQKGVIGSSAKDSDLITAEVYRYLMELVETGVLKPVIDSTFPLERIAEAHALVDSGRKRGAVVVTVG
jgi:NADPH:quinone reductase-like Zn-dependent oxidoreductase